MAIALGIVALASWVAFPLISMAYRERCPVVDTWVMPAIAMTIMDGAAILNTVTVWIRRERSVLSIVTLVVTILAGLFSTFMVVGEAIGSP
jgi:hypothetical protein